MILEIRYLDLDRSPEDGPHVILRIPVTHQTTFAEIKNSIANQALNLDLQDWTNFDSRLNALFSRVADMRKPAFPLLAPVVADGESHSAYFAIIEG
jgi:hypothetical protein